MNAAERPDSTPFPLRHTLPVIVATALLMLLVPSAIEWYGERVSLPRYCADPDQALHYLEANLRSERPAANAPRKPYLIAAKLLFLVPRKADEPVADYLQRVELEILKHCQ